VIVVISCFGQPNTSKVVLADYFVTTTTTC